MAENQIQGESGLFAQSRLCIVCSEQLNHSLAEELSSAVRDHGGEVTIHEPPNPFPQPNEYSHIVSSTIDFLGHDAACDALIPVVKPQWIQASISKRKLANPRQYNPDPRLFLNDVVVSCVDIPEGDKDAIIGGVLAMGGLYTPRITSSTTHLVTLTMESEKCTAARNRGLKIKIVLPHWFDDCLKLRKRIDERPYMLPNPEILRVGPAAPVRITENKDVIGASTPEPSSIPPPLQSSADMRHGFNVFANKKVMISADLRIGERLLQSIEELITNGSGEIVQNVHDTDIYICRYREGDDYKTASRLGKDVGNLSWLYHLITHNAWTSPLRRLLHYPIARNGIPGFKDFKISLSNYAGEARIYLENLVAAAGAECTKTLKQDNTHLITAHGNSEKCTAAKEWNLHVVNHLWLEESYSKWQLQTISEPRYTHFPRRTNLSEVVGRTTIDKFAVEENFFPAEVSPAAARSSEGATRQRVKNASTTPGVGEKEGTPASKTKSGKKATESAKAIKTPKGPQESRGGSKSANRNLQTPIISKFLVEEKENQTPSTAGSRKSKDMAAARLLEIAPDVELYEKEKKRVGGVIYGGRRRSGDHEITKKRSVEPEDVSDMDESKEAKKLKKARPAVTMRIVITGYTRWVRNAKIEESDRRQLRDLGILIVQDSSRCTHLAAPAILRTHKFVNALAYAPVFISCDFVTDCIQTGELLDVNEYLLQDKASEKKYNVDLEKAIQRAQVNKNQLLQGHTIYCVENIRGGFDAFKSIVETNGGQCVMFRGRPGVSIGGRRRGGDDSQDEQSDEVYLISGAEKSDVKLWNKFRTLAQNAKRIPKIVRADWLLDIAMAQEWRENGNFELEDADVEMKDD